ncbi:MAG: PqqD family protein [Vicinamibacteraceae bacterium]
MSADRDQPSAATPIPQDHVVFTDLDGVEGVLVDLETKHYFQLNATASLIWRGLIRNLPVEHIAQEMTAEYDVALDRARVSVAATIGEFAKHRLVTSPRARTAP